MKAQVETAIRCHAEECYPEESCGFLIRVGDKESYYPCKNESVEPEEHFRIGARQWIAAEAVGQILAVVHSHPDWTAKPSEADLARCESSGLPWYIIECRGGVSGALERIEPHGYVAPLLGRSFHHGTLDCLQIILDYYEREMGIHLGQYDREDDWWNQGKDYYRELLPKAGFYEVKPEDLQQGDVILMQIDSPVPNHAGVYLADGQLKTEDCYPQPGVILHHLYNRLSKRDNYGGYWHDVTVGYWRHKDANREDQNYPALRNPGN